MKRSLRAALFALLLSAATLSASDHTGKVTLMGVSIPGATVTAKQADKTLTTITDQDGIYKFTGLADGAWSVTVSMVGFQPMTREITLPASAEGVWELTMLPIEKIVSALPTPRPQTAEGTNGQPAAAAFSPVSGPIRTPSDWTTCVSYALVSMAIS